MGVVHVSQYAPYDKYYSLVTIRMCLTELQENKYLLMIKITLQGSLEPSWGPLTQNVETQ